MCDMSAYAVRTVNDCHRCGYSLSQSTRMAKRNAARLAMPDNPHPLVYNYYCAHRKNWMEVVEMHCDSFIHPMAFDVNNDPIPTPVSSWRYLALGFAGMSLTMAAVTLVL